MQKSPSDSPVPYTIGRMIAAPMLLREKKEGFHLSASDQSHLCQHKLRRSSCVSLLIKTSTSVRVRLIEGKQGALFENIEAGHGSFELAV